MEFSIHIDVASLIIGAISGISSLFAIAIIFGASLNTKRARKQKEAQEIFNNLFEETKNKKK